MVSGIGGHIFYGLGEGLEVFPDLFLASSYRGFGDNHETEFVGGVHHVLGWGGLMCAVCADAESHIFFPGFGAAGFRARGGQESGGDGIAIIFAHGGFRCAVADLVYSDTVDKVVVRALGPLHEAEPLGACIYYVTILFEGEIEVVELGCVIFLEGFVGPPVAFGAEVPVERADGYFFYFIGGE